MAELSKHPKTKSDKMATLSLLLALVGALLDMFIVGIPFTIASIVLAIKSLKIGNFTEHMDSAYSDFEEETSYNVRAYAGLAVDLLGIIILIAGIVNM